MESSGRKKSARSRCLDRRFSRSGAAANSTARDRRSSALVGRSGPISGLRTARVTRAGTRARYQARARGKTSGVASSSTTRRVTWNAVTSGTPSCSTLAVIAHLGHAAGRGPEHQRRRGLPGEPRDRDRRTRPTAQSTATRSRRPRRRSDVRRAGSRPGSAIRARSPRRHCPAFDTSGGINERSIDSAVSGIATASEPSTKALGMRRRCKDHAAREGQRHQDAKPAAVEHLRALHVGVGAVHAERGDRRGHEATTMRMRRLCAAAMRSMRPPKRSPRIDISDAPPGTLAKMPVVLSNRARRASTMPAT